MVYGFVVKQYCTYFKTSFNVSVDGREFEGG